MDQISPEFFVYHNLITTYPDTGEHTENSILFLAEYCLLFKEKFGRLPFTKDEVKQTIEFFLVGKDHFVAYPDSYDEEKENPWSHDNHTGAMTLSYLYGLDYHHKIGYKYLLYRIQPWNICYYLILSNPVFKFLAPIVVLKHLHGSFNYTEGSKTDTSGRVLAYLQLGVLGLTKTRNFCQWLLSKNTMFKSYKEVFAYYFKYDNHPNRKIWNL